MKLSSGGFVNSQSDKSIYYFQRDGEVSYLENP